MSDNFRKSSDIIDSYFSNLTDSDIIKTVSYWKEILSKINTHRQSDTERVDIGSQLADHSKIADIKNGTVFVETDHPARIQLFSMYRKFILECLKNKFPELGIRSITFYIAKQKKKKTAGLRDVSSEEIEKAIEKRTETSETNNDNKEREVNEDVKKMFSGFFS